MAKETSKNSAPAAKMIAVARPKAVGVIKPRTIRGRPNPKKFARPTFIEEAFGTIKSLAALPIRVLHCLVELVGLKTLFERIAKSFNSDKKVEDEETVQPKPELLDSDQRSKNAGPKKYKPKKKNAHKTVQEKIPQPSPPVSRSNQLRDSDFHRSLEIRHFPTAVIEGPWTEVKSRGQMRKEKKATAQRAAINANDNHSPERNDSTTDDAASAPSDRSDVMSDPIDNRPTPMNDSVPYQPKTVEWTSDSDSSNTESEEPSEVKPLRPAEKLASVLQPKEFDRNEAESFKQAEAMGGVTKIHDVHSPPESSESENASVDNEQNHDPNNHSNELSDQHTEGEDGDAQDVDNESTGADNRSTDSIEPAQPPAAQPIQNLDPTFIPPATITREPAPAPSSLWSDFDREEEWDPDEELKKMVEDTKAKTLASQRGRSLSYPF